jgi:regulator of protease activity HflC (stomatin/prohibitin superfamily)
MTMADAGVPRQAGTNWGRFVVTLIVGGVPTAICFILGWWWWGTVFLLLTLFAACFSFSTLAYPIVFSLYAMFAVAWLSGAWLDVTLHQPGVGDTWWRTALPILGGTAIGIVLPVLFWFVTFAVSTKWVLGLAESHEIGWWQAFSFVATRAFGFARPYVLVSNGEMTTGSERGLFDWQINPELLSKFGGPGVLVVGEGNVVVLERGGRLSRILGQGTYALQPGEWFKKPVDTKGIHDLRGGGGDPVEVKQVVTKDGIPLDITIAGRCRLELKADTDKRPSSRFAGGEASSPVIAPDTQYAIYWETIRKAVYDTGKGAWKTVFPRGAQGALRDVVSTYTFDQIFGPPGAGQGADSDKRVLKQIEDAVKEQVGERPSSMGIVFGGIGITDIVVPEDMDKALRERWAAPIKREVLIGEAQAEVDAQVVTTGGRIEKISRLEETRLDATDKWVGILERLKEVLPEMSNERVAYQFVSVIRDLLSRVGVDERDDLKRLIEFQRLLVGEVDRHRGVEYMPVPRFIEVEPEPVEEDEEQEPES